MILMLFIKISHAFNAQNTIFSQRVNDVYDKPILSLININLYIKFISLQKILFL